MSDFTPNGILYILKNVPLDPDYEKTLYFDNEQTQFDYFKSKRDTTLSWENRQYQKVGKGTLRVKALADKLYDCNYLMFQNRKYGNGNKWFYAFIREVRYINDDTSEIVYTLDVMQTWLFQYKDSMEECYVEREHTVSDELYEHVVPENLTSGDAEIVNEFSRYGLAADTGNYKWAIVILCSDPWKYNLGGSLNVYISPQGKYPIGNALYPYTMANVNEQMAVSDMPQPPFTVNNVKTPLYIYTFSQEQIDNKVYTVKARYGYVYTDPSTADKSVQYRTQEINASLVSFYNSVNKESIVYAFYYPQKNGITLDELSQPYKASITPPTVTNQYSKWFKGISQNYVPKNNKLYTYPYSQLEVTNNAGQKLIYKFELFDKGTVEFDYAATVLLNPEFRIVPKDYGHATLFPQLIKGLTLTQLPELAFTVNAYEQYLINNGTRLAAGTVGDFINGGISATAGAFGAISPTSTVRGIAGSLESVVDKVALLQDKKNKASDVIGTVNTPSLVFSLNQTGFEFRTMRINGEMAKIIDEYFTRYGYKCMEIKKPNLKARPYFTYTKTIQCEINASIPQDDLENIKSVFNMGTTFWYINEPTTGVFPQDELIGKYLTVDNQPVTTTGG